MIEWPSLAEQEAVKAVGCTCIVTRNSGPDPQDDAEQDPCCAEHGDRNFMRAMLVKMGAIT